MKLFKKINILFILFIPSIINSCTSIDCPLETEVYYSCKFYSSTTKEQIQLSDTLTITTIKDSVLYNLGVEIDSLDLPMSYNNEIDTLLLKFSNTQLQSRTDTLCISHTSFPHFESLDCPASIFHTIESLELKYSKKGTMPNVIDSIQILSHTVDYERRQNLRIYISKS